MRYFARYGEIESCRMTTNKSTNQRKCIIRFKTIESARKCYEEGIKKLVKNMNGQNRDLLCKPCNRKDLLAIECKGENEIVQEAEDNYIDRKFIHVYQEFAYLWK